MFISRYNPRDSPLPFLTCGAPTSVGLFTSTVGPGVGFYRRHTGVNGWRPITVHVY